MAEPDTSEVREKHRFSQAALDSYLSANLPDFPLTPPEPLMVRQYRSGQSNPTFYLQKGTKQYVLRKKPHGPLLPGAHRGRIFRDVALTEVSPAERSALYVAVIETLARLHSFDLKALDLQGYGRGEGYCLRQVQTWKNQYKRAANVNIPAMQQLTDWLLDNVPANDNEEKLTHGDFRIDNIIFHSREARVVAVLDWELSTLGNPIADLAYLAVPFLWPSRFPVFTQGNDISLQNVEGIPALNELIAIYYHCRGIPTSLSNWNFFIALACLKLAGISQGVYARYTLGNSSAEDAYRFAEMVKPLAEKGLELAKRGAAVAEAPVGAAGELSQQSQKGRKVLQQLKEFMKQHVLPAEQEVIEYYAKHESSQLRWKKPLTIHKLKEMAKAEGLWNLFLPAVSGLTQTDYALIAEETGKCFFAPEIFNCQAPDTGNMEVLHLYGTAEQKKQWLEPLLQGKFQSCFCMTEPDVASSDATNMECTIQRDGDSYIIKGKKWWSSGAGNPDCKVAIVMGKTRNSSLSKYKQHSMILVPFETPGVKIIRPLKVFGYDDAPHGGHFEVHFEQVQVPASNMILGEGRGFEIAQGRLGPGRIHHCMRTIGLAERALQILCERAAQRKTFGKKLYEHEVVAHWIAECRIDIEQARLLTLRAAKAIDTVGSAGAKKQIAMIKVAAPRMACKVVDRALQVCGAAGFSQDFPLGLMFAHVRSLRIADGPDEVHLSAIAKMELMEQAKQLSAKM
ncbi:acyl-CoA dehydrogenase family member 11 isoform X2 [Rhinatrema bivittatum]|uniref:acyl-CoA dehydrogenase family member 11 isoform X2 n=1 Tax=Rhinatrema bivittatum TaxID=194408 RepID=UPI00112DA6FD|nr:acyl-CoA dehydrogenase family member 11 isoform X2 [Rhinatrema bivittatum]